jgi:hypothetical protein
LDGGSTFSAPAVAAAATEHAIARLLRGTTWQAVTREIAWHAAAAADGDYELAELVVGVADEVLSELIDGMECRVDAAAVRGWDEHIQWRPHDFEGAELVATIAAAEEAERLVVAAHRSRASVSSSPRRPGSAVPKASRAVAALAVS